MAMEDLEEALLHACDPAEITFTMHGVEYVCESTGVFLTTEKIQPHLEGRRIGALEHNGKEQHPDEYHLMQCCRKCLRRTPAARAWEAQ